MYLRFEIKISNINDKEIKEGMIGINVEWTKLDFSGALGKFLYLIQNLCCDVMN